MLSGQWRTVDEAEDWLEALQFPSFGVENTLLVRVVKDHKRHYTGCYDAENSEWLDIGAESEAMRRHPWRVDRLDFSYDKQWQYANNALSMLVAVRLLIPKTLLTHTLIKISENVVEHFYTKDVISAILAGEKHKELSRRTMWMRRAIAYEQLPPGRSHNLIFALGLCEIVAGRTSLIAEPVNALIELARSKFFLTDQDAEKYIIKQIHEALPFQEIVLGLLI